MRKAFVTPQTEKYTVVLSVLQGHLKHSHENRYLRRGLYIGSAILNGKFKFNVFSKGLKILSDISLYRKYSLYFVIRASSESRIQQISKSREVHDKNCNGDPC
jgi:hypothetical protein